MTLCVGFNNDLIAELVCLVLNHSHLCGTEDITSNLIMFFSSYCCNKTDDLDISRTLLTKSIIWSCAVSERT